MTDSDKAICHVRFSPDGIAVDVEKGTTLLEAAHKADVYVNSICGGTAHTSPVALSGIGSP